MKESNELQLISCRMVFCVSNKAPCAFVSLSAIHRVSINFDKVIMKSASARSWAMSAQMNARYFNLKLNDERRYGWNAETKCFLFAYLSVHFRVIFTFFFCFVHVIPMWRIKMWAAFVPFLLFMVYQQWSCSVEKHRHIVYSFLLLFLLVYLTNKFYRFETRLEFRFLFLQRTKI